MLLTGLDPHKPELSDRSATFLGRLISASASAQWPKGKAGPEALAVCYLKYKGFHNPLYFRFLYRVGRLFLNAQASTPPVVCS